MPELPEVETVRRGLENLVGQKIVRVFLSDKKLRIDSSLDLQDLVNAKILEILRRARYLIINFSNKKSLILHLGMSGKISVSAAFEQLKHDHFVCEFADKKWLIFNDARRFGFVDLVETKNLAKHKMLAKLACEPLSSEFDLPYFSQKLRHKKMNIKTTLMDNEIVVGVGNIYANESLFDAAISPLRDSCNLQKNEVKKLLASIKKIIKSAIDFGGSSISDYVHTNGDSGKFQNNFKVYGREKLNCLLCKTAIQRIVQNGRSTFYCASCQK